MAVPIFMIVSGFTNTLSSERNNFTKLKQFYTKKELVYQFSKILKPYLIIILIEYVIGFYQLIVLNSGPFVSFVFKDYLFYFLTGGTTPGSYYIPILFQLILLYPLMFISFKKSPKISLLFFISTHFIFDIVANYLPIPTEIYRLLIFRYFVFIIFGIALYYYYNRLAKSLKYFNLISIIYILVYSFGYRMKIFEKWPNTSLPTVFWALTIVVWGMYYLERKPNNQVLSLFSRLGKASYHIFLVQKLLFGFGLNELFFMLNLNIVVSTVLSIISCSFFGLLFYNIETKKLLK